MERNLNRSDIEELSGDENDDPDFFSDLLSFAAADAKEREEKKEERRKEELERKHIQKKMQILTDGGFDPEWMKMINLQRALGGFKLSEFRSNFTSSRPVKIG